MKEYKLFFSYQSDTKHEFQFIKNILDNEVKIGLNGKDIELQVDLGMRDVAGNPDLLTTMFNKADNCEIFLADLTYTTEFINSNGETKHVPNPNVMLELGHAWSTHKYSHTISIQNTAKGEAKDLPVDLRGFRYPISYELKDDASIGDRDKSKKTLSIDLIRAIEAVISFIEDSNKTEYRHFEKFALCQLHNNSYEFIKTSYFDQLVQILKDKLATNRNVIITGKNRCGKSRIIKEFISIEYLGAKQNDILYCKCTQTDPPRLYEALKEIVNKLLRRKTLFILDNCDSSIFQEVRSILNCKEHQCIFIMDSIISTDSIIIKIDPKEYIVDVIGTIQPGREKEITDECGYDIYNVVRTLKNITYTPDKYPVDKDSDSLLGYISLFSKVGFSDNHEKEFQFICNFFNYNTEKGRNIIKQLIEQGYIIYKSGFLYIESDMIANGYAIKIWQNRHEKKPPFDELISQGQLAQSFLNRQIQIIKKESICDSFCKNIVNTNLRQISVVDSVLGQDSIYKLANLYPKEILISLEIVCNENKNYEFQYIYGILHALNIVAKKEKLFNRAIMLLLSLREKSLSQNHIPQIVVEYFKNSNNDFDQKEKLESFRHLYEKGYINIIKDVYKYIFNVNYKDISDNQKIYLSEIFSFLINIRKTNKDWANNLIVENVLVARKLDITRQVFAEIRIIVDEDDVDINVAGLLADKIRWASSDEKKSIKNLLKSISEKSFRNKLYINIILFNTNTLDYKIIESKMSNIAVEILQKKDWEDYIEIFLVGSRKYDANCLWFGYAISQQYTNCEDLITKCLNLYTKIPVEEQSYGFISGLFHVYIKGDDYSIYKERRNELLKIPEFINMALSISNYCENNIDDLINIKNALVTNSLPLAKINNLYNLTLKEIEYCSFSIELIRLSRDGSDAAIKLLYRAKNNCKNINISDCLIEILNRYNYWDSSNYSHDSAYSKLIELLIYTLKIHSSPEFAESVIRYIVEGANNRYFNTNCSVVDLFKILITQHQNIFLKIIEHLLFDKSPETYNARYNIKELFRFQHNADDEIYFEWCEKNGTPAAEFFAHFIPLLKKEDNTDNLFWTDEAIKLMNKYCDNSYVLNIISTRLFNGEVSIAKYSRLKKNYELLTSNDSTSIRLWAIKQAEQMDDYIRREEERNKLYEILDK
jgi:hypothetical protein